MDGEGSLNCNLMMLDYGGVQFAIDIPSNSVKIELEAC
jgi:hypothetical protein